MGKRLCISNISYSVDENELEDLFSDYGEVTESKIAIDQTTLESRGFGFISYESESEAENAIKKLNGHFFKGRVLNVKYAEDRKTKIYASATPFRSSEFINSKERLEPSQRVRVWVPPESRKREINIEPDNQFKRRQRRERVSRYGG